MKQNPHKLQILADQALPFFERTLRQELTPDHVVVAESLWVVPEALITIASEDHTEVLWIPSAESWARLDELQIQKLRELFRSRADLTILLPWAHPDQGRGPSVFRDADSAWAKTRRWNDFFLGDELLADRVIPTENLVYARGFDSVFDPRWLVERDMPWKIEFQNELAHWFLRFRRTRFGHMRRALAIDFDHSLWPGLLSEDEIDLSTGQSEARAARLFQTQVRDLSKRGIFLVGLTKNDPELIQEKFDQVPGQVLRLQDFDLVLAGWELKSHSIQRAAEQLNLSLSHFVFWDDDAAEVELMRQSCPEVASERLPTDWSFRSELVRTSSHFWSLQTTSADRERRGREVLNAGPARLTSADSLEALQVQWDWKPAEASDLARIGQLVQKTNQFNLTGERWSLSEIQARVNDPERRVLVYRVWDRYDDLGWVGAVFLRLSPEGTHIENWVMSCRAFSRQIEDQVWARLKQEFAEDWTHSFRPLPRNQIASNFLVRAGILTTPENRSPNAFN